MKREINVNRVWWLPCAAVMVAFSAAESFPKILAGLPAPQKASPKFWRDFLRRRNLPQNFGGTSCAGNNPTKTCLTAVFEAAFPPHGRRHGRQTARSRSTQGREYVV